MKTAINIFKLRPLIADSKNKDKGGGGGRGFPKFVMKMIVVIT